MKTKRCAGHAASSGVSYFRGPRDIPLLPLTVGRVVDRMADAKGDNVAVVSCHQGISKTYSQLKLDVDQLAAALVSLKLPPGAKIGLVATDIYEWPVVQFATAKAGLVLVNINTAYQVPELEYCLKLMECEALILSEKYPRSDYYAMLLEIAPELEHCKPGELKSRRLPHLKLVILLSNAAKPGTISYSDILLQATPEDYANMEARASRIHADDPVNVQLTSGTTGKPKGVLLSHFGIINNALSMGRMLGFHEQDEIICLNVPMIQSFACIIGTLNAALFGSTIVMAAPGFSGLNSLEAISKHRCTVIYGTPRMFTDMLRNVENSSLDVSSVRKGLIGATSGAADVIKHCIRKLNTKRMHILYGSTECSPVVTVSTPDQPMDEWIHTVGKPLDHVEVKVVDSEHNTVPLNTRGELCVRGYLVFLEYYNQPDRTKQAVRDGWYYTGDEVIMTESGHVKYIGRIKDKIHCGTESVCPVEVEEFLYSHPDIEEVHVVGVPDARLGENVCAWVKLKAGRKLTEGDIKKFCDGKISYFKIPEYILFVDTFPKTVSGKVQKFKMREESRKKLNL
ncbi:medium-chain acyl-CoA ligase ACSF2, mitochondrial-like isoform X2 [Haemaphysalis longicornis]